MILTGSSNPPDEQTRHSGAGRIGRLRVRTMSLSETNTSENVVSFKDVLAGENISEKVEPLSIEELIDIVLVGGWPGLLNETPKVARTKLKDYIKQTIRTDIKSVTETNYNSKNVLNTMESIARNMSTQAGSKRYWFRRQLN